MPYVDLTCAVLGIGDEPGEMEYFTREDGAGRRERGRAYHGKLGCDVVRRVATAKRDCGRGVLPRPRATCMRRGRCAQRIRPYRPGHEDPCDGRGPRGAPRCGADRASMPGAKDLMTEAVMAGGAFPHRLGLSETVLVFDHHLTFFGGFEAFVEQLPDIKGRCVEKAVCGG
ncbi:MAG: hypothetical protein ACLSGS_05420 [Adlercreutzia sp.]